MTASVQFWIYQITFWSSALSISYTMERRDDFWRRFWLCMAVQSFINVVFYLVLFNFNTGLGAEIVMRLLSASLMIVLLRYCWKLTNTMAVYNAVWAIAIWQMLKELWNLAEISFAALTGDSIWKILCAMLIHFTIGFLICAKTIATWLPIDRKNWVGPRQLTTAVCILGIVNALSFSPALRGGGFSGDWLLMFMSQCFCIIILYLQNEIFKREYMKDEINMMKLLLKKEQDQYHMTKENIALINQKCHDMKHQIRALRNATAEDREAYLEELEDTIQIYEAMVKTGNEVLDTILTDKSLYCKDRQIKISCVVDGSQMGFINTIDLYALLGNAIDNAIEAVEKFKNIEKRQIDVMAYRQQSFLVLNIINPVKVEPVYEEEGELPVTIKKDKKFHGFGLRSMKYILEKYDGYLNVTVEDGCFDLKMLIPIPAGQ